MRTRNEILVRAPLEPCLRTAYEVERWPEILPHYREVRFRRRDGPGRGRVYMSAYRHFGPLPYPTWWESEMVTDRDAAQIRYRHVAGITEGMEVLWDLEETGAARALDAEPARAEGPAEPGGGEPAGPEGEEGPEPATRILVLHEWDGPGWPLVGRFAARRVIGPHFVRVVADRTLAGVRAEAEARAPTGTGDGRP